MPLERTHPVYTYLTTQVGPRLGGSVLLSRASENLLGRGQDCHVYVNDNLASRVHASLFERDGRWYVRDLQSRNGTFLDGQRIVEQELADGMRIRIGGTEFSFQQSEQPPTVDTPSEPSVTQTIIRDAHLGMGETAAFGDGSPRSVEQSQDLEGLYQLSLRLWSCHTPQEVLRSALPVLLDRTRASAVAFLALTSSRRLLPHLTVPDDAADKIQLSETMTRLVCDDRRAVWIANQRTARGSDQPEHFADALCVPLLVSSSVAGALYVHLERGRFRQTHFELAIGIAGLTATAWGRAHREQSLALARFEWEQQSAAVDPWSDETTALRAQRAELTRAVATESPLLITGEPGTGRRALAARIHRLGPRSDAARVVVDCRSADPADLEHILFGRPTLGGGSETRLEAAVAHADLGTLVVHEVQLLTAAAQQRLLGVLNGELIPPGETVIDRRVDVRVLSTTSVDLEALVAEGYFRPDLYERLSGLRIALPPLRDRPADLGALIDQTFRHAAHRQGRMPLELSTAAKNRLLAYAWPGNLHELTGIIEAAVAASAGSIVEASALGLSDGMVGEIETLNLEHWERRLISLALKQSSGNIPEAARLLGMGRATLYRKLEVAPPE